MIGAVAVGMFHRPELGLIIAGSHYISSILLGLIMRFYRGDQQEQQNREKYIKQDNSLTEHNILKKALNELVEARKNDGRNPGKLMGDAVRESVNTLLMIGGFIILFSVVTRILALMGIVNLLSSVLVFILQPFNFSSEMVLPLISGIFEITNGVNLASQTSAPLMEQLIICSIIIAWSGLSVHGQVATMVDGTDINLKPYIYARIIQGLLAGFTTYILLIFSSRYTEPVFSSFLPAFSVKNNLQFISILILFILSTTLFLSLLIYFLRKIRITFFRVN